MSSRVADARERLLLLLALPALVLLLGLFRLPGAAAAGDVGRGRQP